MLADSKHHADDNAEHFYRYLMNNQPRQNIIFLLSTKAPDWPRLNNEGFNLVAFSRHIVSRAIKYAAKVFVSHTDLIEQYSDIPSEKFIYLGHGIKKDDDNARLGKLKINTVVVGSVNEYRQLNEQKPETWKHVVLTGLPRHDALVGSENSTEDVILIMPTWRKYISRKRKHRSLADGMGHGFFRAWKCVLNSPLLKAIDDDYGYKIIFLPHRGVSMHAKMFHCPEYIRMLTYDNLMIQEAFKKARILITDFSSVAFDMAYLRKIVIYYHFDHDEYRKNHYKEGYFNYENDGFGPVCHSVIEVTKALRETIDSIAPTSKYLKRMQKCIPDRDGRNCKRLYDFIKTTNCKPYSQLYSTYDMADIKVKEHTS